MNARKFAIMLGLFALCIVASAQNYNIRTTYYTNLRNTYSLQGSVVETVPSGTTLLVVGNQSRWLRISRNGVEVWMADWVSHTRVAGGQQTQSPSQTSSQIDNCCFVDRQCNSDAEWNNGYWAFQNNQCVAPSQTQTRTSSQPVNTGPSQIDNCCFVDRQCQSDQQWSDGYFAYQNGQCSAPSQSQSPAPSQPVSTGPAQIDNCCFAGWQCNTDEQWSNGYQAYQDNQCNAPSQSSPLPAVDLASVDNCCRVNQQCATDEDWQQGWVAYKYYQCNFDVPITIVGGGGFRSQITDSLLLLKRTSPHWYDYTIRGLKRVVQVFSYRDTYVDTDSKTFYLHYDDEPPAGFTYHKHIVFTASILVHEACHVHRDRSGLRSGGLVGETACTEVQLEAHIAIDPHDSRIQEHRETLATIDDPSTWWWN